MLPVPGRALKAKKVLICTGSLLTALLLYDIFAYLALIIDGNSFAEVFQTYNFFPLKIFSLKSVFSILVYILGIIAAFLSISAGMTAVAIIDFEFLRGNLFCSYKQAILFAIKRIRQFVTSYIAIILFILFVVLLSTLYGLLIRIPFIGEYLYSIFFVFPGFFVILLTVIFIYISAASVILMPAAVAYDKKGESFNSILESFTTIFKKPVRWLLYTAYSIITAKILSYFYAFVAFSAVTFFAATSGFGGGYDTSVLVSSGLALLPSYQSKLVLFIAQIFPYVPLNFNIHFPVKNLYLINHPAAYIMAFSLFIIFTTVWGYMLSVVATGQAYAFAIIKKVRDGISITDEKSLYSENNITTENLEDK